MKTRQELHDLSFMQMAYSLAANARGWASPNPYVGAVVVKEDRVIGHGYHEQPGKPHAEVVALEKAGKRAKGSTLYVTLEPCVHWGRTPPCVESILRYQPRRVVISALDPNPIVYQKGVRVLREAGLEVSVGCLEQKNFELNEVYYKYITKRLPFVILKAALTLDGKIAAADGHSRWLRQPLAREYVHLLRGEVDSLLVGVNTILKDNPRLTVRHPLWGKKPLRRVILDAKLRLPLNSRLLQTVGDGQIIVFTSAAASGKKKEALLARGVEIVETPESDLRLNLSAVLKELARRGIASLLVEGGSQVLTSFLEAKLADKIFLLFSPRLLGGSHALSVFAGKGFPSIKASLGLQRWHLFSLGADIILEGYF